MSINSFRHALGVPHDRTSKIQLLMDHHAEQDTTNIRTMLPSFSTAHFFATVIPFWRSCPPLCSSSLYLDFLLISLSLECHRWLLEESALLTVEHMGGDEMQDIGRRKEMDTLSQRRSRCLLRFRSECSCFEGKTINFPHQENPCSVQRHDKLSLLNSLTPHKSPFPLQSFGMNFGVSSFHFL